MDNKTIEVAIGMGVLCAILYRLGGIGKPFRTWMRDWLIPIALYSYVLLTIINKLTVVNLLMTALAIALTGWALTTYWDWLSHDKDNFYLHGLMVGLGAFPCVWLGIAWWLVLVRAVALGILIGGLNWFVNKYHIPFSDWIEELGRGFLIGVSVLLLLVFF